MKMTMNLFTSKRATKTLYSLYIFFIFAALGTLINYIPLYYDEIGFNGVQISAINVLGSAALILVAPQIGFVADRAKSKQQVLLAGLLIFAFSLGSIPLLKSFIPILLLWIIYRTISGPLYSTSENLSYSVAAKTSEKGNSSFGSIRLWGSVGFALATWLAGWIYQEYGIKANTVFFLVMIAMSILTLMLTSKLVLDSEEKKQEEKLSLKAILKLIVSHRYLFFMALALALSDPTQDGIRNFESIYMSNLGLEAGMIGFANMLSAIGEVPFMIYADRIIRKIGIRNIILFVFVFDILRRLAVWFFPTAEMVFATSVLTSFSFTFRLVCSVTLVNLTLPKNVTSTANAFIGVTMFSLGFMISNAIGGFIYDSLGNRYLYLMGAAFSLVSLVLALCAGKNEPKFVDSMD